MGTTGTILVETRRGHRCRRGRRLCYSRHRRGVGWSASGTELLLVLY
jgi:hypothetical protein